MIQNGLISVEVGYITFTPKTATTGQLMVAGTQVEGGSVRVNNSAFTMTTHAFNFSGAYSFTDTTFTTQGATFALSYGNVIAGVAHTLEMVVMHTDGSNTHCLNFDHGDPPMSRTYCSR